MQKLGQHFLKDNLVAEKIIAALRLARNDLVVEIGPGHGELTVPLSRACKQARCRLIAVEKDDRLAKSLELAVPDKIEIVSGDILRFLASPPESFKLAGNIPYYLTGHLLRKMSELKNKPERAVLMVQKEVAERIVAVAPRMNRLAASVQYWADPAIICAVSKNSFNPPPKVDSAVMVLETKAEPASGDAERYFKAVRALFAQPRKTILNNLAALGRKDEVLTLLQRININPGARPQDLTIKDIAAIAASWG